MNATATTDSRAHVTSTSRRVYSAVINNIELILSVAGLFVILGTPSLFANEGSFWRVACITAIGVGLLHGLIFWAVRRRQRRIRQRSIEDVREMLADVVKNQLTTISLYVPQESRELIEPEIQGIRRSIGKIEGEVDRLSEEALRRWQDQYTDTLDHVERLKARRAPEERKERAVALS